MLSLSLIMELIEIMGDYNEKAMYGSKRLMQCLEQLIAEVYGCLIIDPYIKSKESSNAFLNV